jgi:competence protein CoiA
LKIGEIVAPHFAHKKNEACPSFFSEGESKDHLQGKQQLYLFFQQHADHVELEPYFKMLAQRPDLLVISRNKRIPIEFQCSTIPVADMESRSSGYRSIGMDPIWILRTPEKFVGNPQGVGIFHLSHFDEHFLTRHSPEGRVLLTYNPQTERFHYYSSLFHVVGNRHIGIHRTLSSSMQIFPFARPKTPTAEDLQKYTTIYLSMRNQFLQSRILLNRKGIRNSFLRICYELRLLPTELPLWIGVPVRGSDAFREHDCEWQLTLLYYMRRKGISLNNLSQAHVRKYLDRMEQLSERKEHACLAYRDFLLAAGIVPLHHPNSIDEQSIYAFIAARFLAKGSEN